MKKLIPILTVILALFAGNLAAQENNDTEVSTTKAKEEGAKEEGNETKGDETKGDETKEPEDTNPVFDYSALSMKEGEADSGDTAWMIVATSLVLLMTIPGLALFYGGLTRKKNVLSVLVQCFACTALMSLLWVLYGYSFATSGNGLFFGDFSKKFLEGVTPGAMNGSMPESLFVTFQMTFAIITPALIVGAFAERMKFSAVMIFLAIWFTFSYCPVWHMVWTFDADGNGIGYLAKKWGAIDFAGGTVVHINAGVAALVACIVLGKRKGYPDSPMPPHNVPFVIIGAALLWVGWFGFNAGSAVTAGHQAAMAQLVTQVATAAAAFTWMMVEWMGKGKPTAVGIATGAVAGLVAITPASGSVGPLGSIAIGVAAGIVCYWASTSLKKALGYDDSFDVFGVHGIGGIVGALLSGVFALSETGQEMIKNQFSGQAVSVLVTIIWSGTVAFIAIKIAGVLCGGIRSSEDDEIEGLDVTDHGEGGYQL
jgi:Amt family ammonium transporter